MKILIIIVMMMIFFIPMLDWGFWVDDDKYVPLATYIENTDVNDAVNNNLFLIFLNNSVDSNFPILNITNRNNTFYVNDTINKINYRNDDVGTVLGPKQMVSIYFLKKAQNQVESIIDITKTIFLCIILIVASLYFEGDADELVLKPLDVMTEIINKVKYDPIGSRNIDALNEIKDEGKKGLEENENGDKLQADASEGVKDPEGTDILNTEQKKQEKEKELHKKQVDEIMEENAELQLVQRSIIKISALLAIGFGEAGSTVIKENLKSSNSELDPMMKGSKTQVMVGFCDIRDFSVINEALKEDCVIFINRIADIVHSCVDRFGGATNKNIGEAFLNIWKFPELNNNKVPYEISPKDLTSKIAVEKAVLSFLYVLKFLNYSQEINDFSKRKEIIDVLGENYKFNMGFGIHMGWAIEGTIGSKHKIDASYLSPNVNISARLEAATRQYGVSLLISGEVYKYLSDEMQNVCREIDRVTVKGSNEALRIFTIDVNLSTPDEKDFIQLDNTQSSNEKLRKLLEKKILYKRYYDQVDGISALNFRTGWFLEEKLYSLFDKAISNKFKEEFSQGFESYINGNWENAAAKLENCLVLNPNDKPSENLLKYINSNNNIAPRGWIGVRGLTSK
jgi:class 3 adenylate cyclase